MAVSEVHVKIGSAMTYRLIGIKPLPEPTLTYRQEQSLMRCKSK